MPGRMFSNLGPKFFSMIWFAKKKKKLSMEVPQIQDGPSEPPPGTGCSQTNTQQFGFAASDRLNSRDRKEEGTRGTGGCKGSRTMRKGFGGDHGGCARETLLFWAQTGYKVNK